MLYRVREFHMKREKTNPRLYIPADKTHKDNLNVAKNQPFSVEQEAAIFCSKTRTTNLYSFTVRASTNIYTWTWLMYNLTSEPLIIIRLILWLKKPKASSVSSVRTHKP